MFQLKVSPLKACASPITKLWGKNCQCPISTAYCSLKFSNVNKKTWLLQTLFSCLASRIIYVRNQADETSCLLGTIKVFYSLFWISLPWKASSIVSIVASIAGVKPYSVFGIQINYLVIVVSAWIRVMRTSYSPNHSP